MQNNAFLKQLLASVFSAQYLLLPGLVWAATSNKQVMDISSAVVGVPTALIMVAIIVRNYMRYQHEELPCEEMHKYAKKTKYFTVLITSIPVINLFSQAVYSPSFALFGKALLLSLPNVLLGVVSYKLSLLLEQKHQTHHSEQE